MRKLLGTAIVCGLLLITGGLQAQPEDEAVLLYDGAQIQVVTSAGLAEPLPLPEGAQGVEPYHGLGYMSLATDQQSLVFSRSVTEAQGAIPTATLEIADLEAQTCCTLVESPLESPADTIIVGPFSPDGTQVAVIFASVYSGSFESQLAVVDVPAGTVAQSISLQETFNDIGLLFRGWTEAGIEGSVTCLACGGVLEGYTVRWNPETGETTEQVSYFNLLGSKLDATGEYIIPARDESLPTSNMDGMMLPQNIVQYLPEGDPEQAAMIFHDPMHLTIGGVQWVLDGQAYLITEWVDGGLLVFRDGRTLPVPMNSGMQFLGSLADSWLMQDFSTQTVIQFHVDGDAITQTPFDALVAPVTVLHAPVQGSSELLPPVPVINH